MEGHFMQGVRRFLKDDSGNALIEFALAFPVLLLLFYAAVELTRYILFHEKIESAAIQLLDVVNQTGNVSAAELDNVFSVTERMMAPFTNVTIQPRLTMVERPVVPAGKCRLKSLWDYGGGPTRIRPDAEDQLPEMQVMPGDTVGVMEMTGKYIPLLDDVFGSAIIGNVSGDVYVRSYSRPRYGAFRINPNTRNYVTLACE